MLGCCKPDFLRCIAALLVNFESRKWNIHAYTQLWHSYIRTAALLNEKKHTFINTVHIQLNNTKVMLLYISDWPSNKTWLGPNFFRGRQLSCPQHAVSFNFSFESIHKCSLMIV